MSLLSYYNASIINLNNASLIPMATGVYEAAFGSMYPYLIILALISFIAYIKTSNLGLFGVSLGIGTMLLVYLGKLPAYMHLVPVGIIIASFGLTAYLFFTERSTS